MVGSCECLCVTVSGRKSKQGGEKEEREGGERGRGEREGREGGERGRGEREGREGGERGRGEREGREGGERGRGEREGREGGEDHTEKESARMRDRTSACASSNMVMVGSLRRSAITVRMLSDILISFSAPCFKYVSARKKRGEKKK